MIWPYINHIHLRQHCHIIHFPPSNGLFSYQHPINKSALCTFSFMSSVKVRMRMCCRTESCRFPLPHVSTLLHRPASVCTTAANPSMATTLPCSYTGSVPYLCEWPVAREASTTISNIWDCKCSVPWGDIAQHCAPTPALGLLEKRKWDSRPLAEAPLAVTRQQALTTGNRDGDSVTVADKKRRTLMGGRKSDCMNERGPAVGCGIVKGSLLSVWQAKQPKYPEDITHNIKWSSKYIFNRSLNKKNWKLILQIWYSSCICIGKSHQYEYSWS